MPAPARPLVLFDDVCNLCNAAVRWLIARDRGERLRFTSLRSGAARAALAAAGVTDPETLPDSIVLIDDSGVRVRSSAVLRIAGVMGFPYRLALALLVIPRPVRDLGYDVIARRRYHWFGRSDACSRHTTDV